MDEIPRQAGGWVKGEVLRQIKQEHIHDAIRALDAGEQHRFGPSTDYDLVSDGKSYPPKAVLGVAAQYAIGQKLGPDDFSGGESSTCFAVLRDRGFEIVPKVQAAKPIRAPRTWIFQAQPDDFDIDAYLAAGLPRISWTLRTHKDQVLPGDHVYLWRAAGKRKAVSGIIARADVISEPWIGPDEAESLPFWLAGEPDANEVHVWLRVGRVANKKEVIKRDWLKADPVCHDLTIVRRAAGTNFAVPPHHQDRLDRLWERTAIGWDRSDCVAGLWVYATTHGSAISKKPGSPVSDVALRIGRAVGGVYNKVLNFRGVDPRDERAGLPGHSAMDETVWAEFFDGEPHGLNVLALEREFQALWGDSESEVTQPTPGASKGTPPPPTATARPALSTSTTTSIVRDPRVAGWVKEVHKYSCQVCGVQLRGRKGPIAEGAHIRPLGAQHRGPDDVSNILCLCPNHHALFDAGAFAIADDFALLPALDADLPAHLRMMAVHEVMKEHVRYHREKIAKMGI